MENILGEYSLFFKPSMWNYLHLNWISLYRNDFVIFRRPEPSLLSRDGTTMEDELTQYTLTPTVIGDSSAAKDKVKAPMKCIN